MNTRNKIIIRTRLYRTNELFRIVSLINRSYDVAYKPGKMTIEARETINKIKRRIKLGNRILVAKKNDRILGAVCYRSVNKRELKLSRLAVLSRYRRKGIGSLLIKKVTDIARRNDHKIISLDVAEEKGLVPFYKKFGFKVKSKKKHQNHYDIFMEKKI